MKKALPLGAKIVAIQKAIKSGQKFYLHTYVGEAEVVGIDAEGTFAMAKGRTWAISSTDINRWYKEIKEITITPQQRVQLKRQVAVRKKIGRRKEDERRQRYFK